MAISIGGAPGTGSSLLRQMLNRHPQIYCGPETNLFAFPVLFTDWRRYRARLTQNWRPTGGRLIAPTIRLVLGTRLAGREQTWAAPQIKELAARSETFKDFCDTYFAQPCAVYGKQVWAEKTPANVLTFQQFLRTWGNGVVVHMTRTPADTIVSLLDRGTPLFEAAARYLFNCAHALKAANDRRWVSVRYEDLVTDPEQALSQLLGRLDLTYGKKMTMAGNPAMEETDQLEGWRYRETEPPQTGSLNRYEQTADDVRLSVAWAIRQVRITDAFAQQNGLTHHSISDCANEMGYQLPDLPPSGREEVADLLSRQEKAYRRRRLMRNSWWYERNKPLAISDL
ncbi:MAG: sulfotransferase [Saprospiraceae bacterium]|nr:sulfotransferase [Saprospiraceae bacterium]